MVAGGEGCVVGSGAAEVLLGSAVGLGTVGVTSGVGLASTEGLFEGDAETLGVLLGVLVGVVLGVVLGVGFGVVLGVGLGDGVGLGVALGDGDGGVDAEGLLVGVGETLGDDVGLFEGTA